MHYMNSNHFLSSKQHGFRPQMSTISALKAVNEYIIGYFDIKWEVLLISLDVQGAFDAAWWPVILKGLKERKCPKNLFQLSKSYFTERSASINLNSVSKEAVVSRGCPQGSCCGPGFWVIMYDDLLRLQLPDRCDVIAFADNLLILVAGKSGLELNVDANRILTTIENWALANKITFNKNKSKVLHMSRRDRINSENIAVYLDGVQLEMVDQLKAAKVHWGLGSRALSVIYKGAFLPLITYAAPSWRSALGLRKNRQKLKRVQRLFLLRLIKGYRTISFSAAGVIAGVMPICFQIEQLSTIDTIQSGGTVRDWGGAVMDAPVGFKDWLHPAEIPTIHMDLEVTYDTDIFTDGSKDGDFVGCAFIVMRLRQVVVQEGFRLAAFCSNNQAEQLALDWVEGHFFFGEKVRIATDSRITLDSLRNRKNHNPLVEMIRTRLCRLRNKCTISFSWVRAHVGIIGNETADLMAKAASKDSDLTIAYNKFPKTALKQWAYQRSVEAWEQFWNESTTGALTRDFIPSVRARLRMDHFAISYGLTQVLTGHGKMAHYLLRFVTNMSNKEYGLQLCTSFAINNSNSKRIISGLSEDDIPIAALKGHKAEVIYISQEDWRVFYDKRGLCEDFFKKKKVEEEEIRLQYSTMTLEKKGVHKVITFTAKPTWMDTFLNLEPPKISLLRNEYFQLLAMYNCLQDQFNYLSRIYKPCTLEYNPEDNKEN
ncbi:uncharacterized protein [Rhodnius prolixus]|uniref:uncharacterized protein n=1 Tax=Rhodnius prolixus TaxID=13249 RepID=UPI003D189A85